MHMPTQKGAMQHACLFVTQPLQLVTASVRKYISLFFFANVIAIENHSIF